MTEKMNKRLQMLNVGGILYFFELDISMYGVPELLCFHCNGAKETVDALNNRISLNGDMQYKGKTYGLVGMDVQGMEMSSDGKVNSPELRIINELNGQKGAVTALCLQYNDLVDAKLTIRMTTLEAYEAGTLEEIEQVWWIDRKSNDDGTSVSFELASAMDYRKQQLPTRLIIDLCTWALRGEYRGETCGYTGDKYFDAKGNPVSTIDQDDCGGTCNDCILRFGRGVTIPFGGFLIVNKTSY